MKPIISREREGTRAELGIADEFLKMAEERIWKAYGSRKMRLRIQAARIYINDAKRELNQLVPPQTRKVRRMESRHD